MLSRRGLALLDRRAAGVGARILIVVASIVGYLTRSSDQVPEGSRSGGVPVRSTGRSRSGWRSGCGRGPGFAESYHYDSLASTSSGSPPRPRSWWPRPPACSLHRPGPGPGHRSGGWVRANLASFQRLLAAHRKLDERRLDGGAGLAPVARRVAGAEIGVLLGWMWHPGAGSVRPAGHRGRGPRRPGHRVLRRAQHAGAREALRLPARGVPALAGAPRGHPPGAVHRSPLAAAALPRRWSADRRRGRPRPRKAFLEPSPGWPRPSARAATRSTTGCRWLLVAPGAAGRPRAHRRPDEPARGPRRRHHGPCRGRPGPQRRRFGRSCGSGASRGNPLGTRRKASSASRPR